MTEALEEPNFIVVGSGAAGLVGAIAARLNGLRPVIIEKASCWGGTTAMSGGVIWAPGNALMQAVGVADSPAAAWDYVMRLLGSEPSARLAAKADRYLSTVNDMIDMLSGQGLRWHRNPNHPDYYPKVEGARLGRTLEPELFDGKRLGVRLAAMRGVGVKRPAFYSSELGVLARTKTALSPLLVAARVMMRNWLWTATGRAPLALGRAFTGSLMEVVDRLEIPVFLNTRLVELEVRDGRVAGVITEGAEGRRSWASPAGVLLAAGGFAHNSALRRQYQGDFDGAWSNASPDDQGDGLVAALQIGAGAELLDDAWWQPTVMIAPGQPSLTLGERALPGSIVVDETGRRYMNEAECYKQSGAVMGEHGAARNAHWLIFDQRLLRRYIFRALSDAKARASMERNGYMKSAGSLEALGAACGFDGAVLAETVKRFNGYARTGVDPDFDRGGTDYDRYWGDPTHKPNASLGEIAQPPFHAVRLFPGDIGTNGGVMTDENARVLGADGTPFKGLYAAGNTSSSPFARSYPGGGATVGAAATFGYIAALDAAERFGARR